MEGSTSQKSLTSRLATWLSSTEEEPALLITGFSSAQQEKYIASLETTVDIPFDQYVIAPDGHTIKVKQIKALGEVLHTTSFKGKRLIVFQNIDQIVPAAANMMLKELEEPSKTNRFLLFTSFPRNVLPTIRSRCYIIRMGSEEDEPSSQASTLTDFLQDIPSSALSDKDISQIASFLSIHSQTHPAAYSVLMRLRDYYKIRASNGNEKLAADALLASVNHLRNTIK